MDAQELRTKSESELREQLTGLLHEQFQLRMQKGTGQMTSAHDLRLVRRNIARLRTVMNEKSKEGNAA